MATKNIFYWGTPSFSGTGQFNEGPFHIGDVNRLLRVKIRGNVNYQGVNYGATSVEANLLLWAASWVAHGASPLDVILAGDTTQFLVREQTKLGDSGIFWAPSTDTAAALRTLEIVGDWSGQLALSGADTDMYVSFAPPFGGSTDNFNTYGTVEAWWS